MSGGGAMLQGAAKLGHGYRGKLGGTWWIVQPQASQHKHGVSLHALGDFCQTTGFTHTDVWKAATPQLCGLPQGLVTTTDTENVYRHGG